MKKLLLFTCFSLSLFSAFAQEVRFGFKAGGNYADINGRKLVKDSHSYKLGWHAGVMANIHYPGTDWFSIQPELIYSRKGYESDGPEVPITVENSGTLYTIKQSGAVRFNYLDLPVMFNFKAGIFVFEIGPQISYLIGLRDDNKLIQTYPDNTSTTTALPEEDQISRTEVSKLDLGFATGLRIETESGASLGVRFNQGFVNLRSGKKSSSAVPNGYNQFFQVYISYLLQ